MILSYVKNLFKNHHFQLKIIILFMGIYMNIHVIFSTAILYNYCRKMVKCVELQNIKKWCIEKIPKNVLIFFFWQLTHFNTHVPLQV